MPFEEIAAIRNDSQPLRSLAPHTGRTRDPEKNARALESGTQPKHCRIASAGGRGQKATQARFSSTSDLTLEASRLIAG